MAWKMIPRWATLPATAVDCIAPLTPTEHHYVLKSGAPPAWNHYRAENVGLLFQNFFHQVIQNKTIADGTEFDAGSDIFVSLLCIR